MPQRLFHVPRLVVVFVLFWTLLTSTTLTAVNSSQSIATAADTCQNFPETGFQVCGKFLQYWQSHGGLTQQGFPISGVFFEQQSGPPFGDGKVHKVQYFQRARFEEHTENATPNDVLLGLLGTEQATTKYGPRTTGSEQPQAGCQFFPETGYNVCGAFLAYWNANGGLAQQGFPISSVGSETNQPPPSGDGKVHQVQYFQRARFEEHLELTVVNNTLLGLLGAEQFKVKYPGSPPATVEPPAANPTPVAPPPTVNPPPQPPATQPPVQVTGVKFIAVNGTSPGRTASATVQTQTGVRCDLEYIVPSGRVSTAKGLEPKDADSSGQISWSWLISGNTGRGTGSLNVSCNNGASASAPIVIG